jgi:hypothetical protein
MTPRIEPIFNWILGIVALVLFLFLAMTSAQGASVFPERLSADSAEEGAAPKAATETVPQVNNLQPAEIARRFSSGIAAAPIQRPTVVEAAPPAAVTASWISYVGIISEGTSTRFFFKDARSNRIVSLREGERNGEWSLIKRTDQDFTLEVEGQRYTVSSHPSP